MQAIELGKLQLAGLIQTNMSSLISSNVGNAQLSTQEAASVTEVVQSAKNIIAVELGCVDPSFNFLRTLGKIKLKFRSGFFMIQNNPLNLLKSGSSRSEGKT
jgi:hypothetical protein